MAFGPAAAAALLPRRASPQELTRWALYDIRAPPSSGAAAIVERSEHTLEHLECDFVVYGPRFFATQRCSRWFVDIAAQLRASIK